MIKVYFIALAFGVVSAQLSLAGQTQSIIGLIFANLAMLPIIIAGLAYGTRAVSLATLSGIFIVILNTGLVNGGIYGIIIAFPCWLLARYCLMKRKLPSGDVEWYPIGNILGKITGYGALLLVLAAIVNSNFEIGLNVAVERLFSNEFLSYLTIGGQRDSNSSLKELLLIFPGMMFIAWLLLLLMNAVFAHAILTCNGMAIRPTPSYSTLKAPEWLNWALLGASTIALFKIHSMEFVGRNLVIIFAAPYFYIGMGLIHVILRQFTMPKLAMTAIYLIMLTLVWPMIVVTLLGFFEPFTNLRSRYVTRNTGA